MDLNLLALIITRIFGVALIAIATGYLAAGMFFGAVSGNQTLLGYLALSHFVAGGLLIGCGKKIADFAAKP